MPIMEYRKLPMMNTQRILLLRPQPILTERRPYVCISIPFAACGAIKLLGSQRLKLISSLVSTRTGLFIVKSLMLRRRQLVASPVPCAKITNRKPSPPVSCLEICNRGHTILPSLQKGYGAYSCPPRMANRVALEKGYCLCSDVSWNNIAVDFYRLLIAVPMLRSSSEWFLIHRAKIKTRLWGDAKVFSAAKSGA